MTHIALQLNPVAVPPLPDRRRYLLKWLLIVILWMAFFTILCFVVAEVMSSAQGFHTGWEQHLDLALVISVLVGPLVAQVLYVQKHRQNRWEAAAKAVYTQDVERAKSRVWYVLGAQLNDSTWTIDCYSRLTISRITLPTAHVTLSQADTPVIQFQDISFELKDIAGPARLCLGGDVVLSFPDGATPPPLRDNYWPCP